MKRVATEKNCLLYIAKESETLMERAGSWLVQVGVGTRSQQNMIYVF